jgi:hypothetical protein
MNGDINLAQLVFSHSTRLLDFDRLYIIAVLVLVGCLIIILVITSDRQWAIFAEKRKWLSRLILCALTLLMLPGVLSLQGLVLTRWPVHLAVEQPNLEAIATKLQLYGTYADHEIMMRVPQEKQVEAKCVELLSLKEASEQKWTCVDEDECTGLPPAMNRELIITRIKEIQQLQPAPDTQQMHDICARVDADRL